MKISVIIPSLNDSIELQTLLPILHSAATGDNKLEVIVVEAGDEINTLPTNDKFKCIQSKKSQRAYQMNLGASQATGEILYFLHADSIPPANFIESIVAAIKAGNPYGCFRMIFQPKNPLLSFYAHFTRYDWNIFRGGDQSLFISRSLFDEVGGFDENMDLMEDYDILKRLNKRTRIAILPGPIVTSSRKYMNYGSFRLQWIYFIIQILYRIGASQSVMMSYYQKQLS